MAHRASRLCITAGWMVVVVLFLAACSAEERTARSPQVGVRATSAETPGIVPSPAYSYHQLRLGSDVSASSFGGLTGADKGQLVIWEVNGKSVHTGASLDPSYTSPGDRVIAIVKAADASGSWEELSRHETTVLDSAPRILEVHLQRDTSNPYLVHAVLRAEDPDGERVEASYRWFVDGVLVVGASSPELLLDASAQGAQVVVEVLARDGELQSEAMRSPGMRLEAASVFLEVGAELGVTDLEGGGHEYQLALQHPPDARVELIDAPESVRYSSGVLTWRPVEDESQLRMRVRVHGGDGSSVEREISLQR